MKENFVNQLVISHFHTTLITFLNIRKNVRITYIVARREYNPIVLQTIFP
jgi:hypothetical protein